MSLPSVLADGRVLAEARMTSTALVHRRTSTTTQDLDTGREYPVWSTVLQSQVRVSTSAPSVQTRTSSIPGGSVNLALLTVHFPAGTPRLNDGDLIEVTAGESAGLVLQVLESDPAEQKTAYRVSVQAVQRPEEWP